MLENIEFKIIISVCLRAFFLNDEKSIILIEICVIVMIICKFSSFVLNQIFLLLT